MTSQYRYDIIIIGAGISGLASGKYLQSKGFNVVLLEARNRIGGRLWSDNSLGVTVDLGAAWIHGVKNSSVYDLATKYGVKVVPFPGSNSLPNIVYDHYGNQVKDKKRLKKMWERWDTFEEFLNIV